LFGLWESREPARRASGEPLHRAATEITAKIYESYALERYHLVKLEAGGSLVFRRLEEATPRGNVGTSYVSA
jgi:hypothetical protein